ncbi:MAG: hypothetical protein A3H28_08720 [Acidobacteria bacterium RIFCSPLOWO2_02_FULL_61_28]|nr:MAG: hypothetical protein A3H28_08720 [Acidobacteria bacterium RIFCSPLOWO2_02_FULL_61_28]
MSLWKYFGFGETPEPGAGREGKLGAADTETVRKIVQKLDQLEPARARFIAAFAYLLGRVAHADQRISEEETRAMERIVGERAGLPEEQAILVVQIAKTQNLLFGATENFLVGREFAKIASRDERIAMLHGLYAVCSADRSISVVEDNEIAKISRELRLDHSDFIAVRMDYREHLSVLKNSPPPENL